MKGLEINPVPYVTLTKDNIVLVNNHIGAWSKIDIAKVELVSDKDTVQRQYDVKKAETEGVIKFDLNGVPPGKF